MLNIDLNIFITAGLILCFSLALFIVYFILTYKRKQNEYLLEKQNLKLQFDQMLAQTQIEIQEQTLNTISQEIHDNIGQSLSQVNVQLELLETTTINYETIKYELINSINTAIQDLRDISRSLNTDVISEKGLLAVVEEEIDRINKSKMSASLIIEGKVVKLQPQVELILFRMLQECINNIIKHASATTIDLVAYYGVKNLEITIEDNGKGFDKEKVTRGQGLSNLYNRSKSIRANLEIESIKNSGTSICIIVPYFS